MTARTPPMLPDEVREAVDHIDTEFSMGLEPFESTEDRTEFMDQRCFYVGYWEWIAIRAHLLAREAEVERHVKMLADCFRMAGADTDGNEDWRIAPDALRAVTDLRRDYDDVLDWQTRCEKAEALLREAYSFMQCADGHGPASAQLMHRITAHLGGENND